MLSRQERSLPDGVKLFHSIDEVLDKAKEMGLEELMIVGGAKVYEQFLPLATELILTQVETEVDAPDTYFPDWGRMGFTVDKCLSGVRQEKDEHNFEFEYWVKK